MNHLMTTFIPSLSILSIAQATVYFKTEHFKTSVPVAVSALLGKVIKCTTTIFHIFSCSALHPLHICNKNYSNHILHEGSWLVALVSYRRTIHNFQCHHLEWTQIQKRSLYERGEGQENDLDCFWYFYCLFCIIWQVYPTSSHCCFCSDLRHHCVTSLLRSCSSQQMFTYYCTILSFHKFWNKT